MKDIVKVVTVHESNMSRASDVKNAEESTNEASFKSNKPTENDRKSNSGQQQVASRRVKRVTAHSGLKLNLNLKKASNVKIILSESESSKLIYVENLSIDKGIQIKMKKETTSYMRDKSCERHGRKGKDDIGECIKVINETFKIVENSERKSRSLSKEKVPKTPTNGTSREKSYTRCTASRARKMVQPSNEIDAILKLEVRRRSPSREKSQKSPPPSNPASNKSSKHKVQITNMHESVKTVKTPPKPAAKPSPTKIQRLSERLTAHTESSKRKLRSPNAHDIISIASDPHHTEKTAVNRNSEESHHNAKAFEKSETTHSAREKREVSVRNTKKSQSSFKKQEVVEVSFSRSEKSESYTTSSSSIKASGSGAEISKLLNGAKMEFQLLDAEPMPVIMNGTNMDGLEETDVDYDPANEGKNESGMKSGSKIPRKAQVVQAGMKCNASMKKEATVSFDSGCEDVQL